MKCVFSFRRVMLRSPRLASVRTMATVSRKFDETEVFQVLKSSQSHPYNNVAESIVAKVGKNLHLQKNHPLSMTKNLIEDFCNQCALKNGQTPFKLYDDLSPIVNTYNCFDALRVPPEHVSRRPTDTYYITDKEVLRTHTSAHQVELLGQGETSFLCSGDVYRRDEIDASHYPVFHQIEGVRLFQPSDFPANISEDEARQLVEKDLKQLLEGLARHLFGEASELRWREDYFPFTEPSFELDVYFNGDWMEVLGCGLIHREVLGAAGVTNKDTATTTATIPPVGWAFGLGLERLAMVLYSIPDIRLFWSDDRRFLDQFENIPKNAKIVFEPYSKYPFCYKDVSFWLPENGSYHSNDLYEIVRGVAGDIVEKVEMFDSFIHPKTKKESHAYRMSYRHMDRSLTNEEVDILQLKIRELLESKLGVTLR